jgi:hypothetical protein
LREINLMDLRCFVVPTVTLSKSPLRKTLAGARRLNEQDASRGLPPDAGFPPPSHNSVQLRLSLGRESEPGQSPASERIVEKFSALG